MDRVFCCARFLVIVLVFVFVCYFFFFFNDTATTEISPLPLHAALPIYRATADIHTACVQGQQLPLVAQDPENRTEQEQDRKSTRLNSSHLVISYAVFCLKKKKDMIHT